MFYKVLGMMSGTSLDGLDMAYCEFDVKDSHNVTFQIKKAVTVPYDERLKKQITECENTSSENIFRFSSFLGRYFGLQARKFLCENSLDVDFISSHGQTIFHQPFNGFTVQIGNVNQIAAITGRTVIGDFRSLDVALGGQGAPLVPIGDKILFDEYDSCLNIGGFSNISYDEHSVRIAYDICPSNIVLNHIAERLGYDYDRNGNLAESGSVNKQLLNDLNDIEYYVRNIRQSLGKEFVKQYVFPLLDSYSISDVDKLATYTEHTAEQISKHIKGKVLVTGGGVYNTFLMNRIKAKTNDEVIVPDKVIVEYKEALIFAFLGLRRFCNQINCLASVTGAERDSCSGVIVLGKEI